MQSDERMTVDEFVETRFDLPESGQWSELNAGYPQHLQPPDLDHGTTILNLSKVLSEHVSAGNPGYACFDLGLLMEQNPDTVWYPAVSYFLEGPRFAELDRLVTESIPSLVIEMASTADRRSLIDNRLQKHTTRGVRAVWVIDPADQSLRVVSSSLESSDVVLVGDQVLIDADPLRGLELPVSSLFTEPSWWK